MQVINNSGIRIALVSDEDKKLKGIITDGDIRRAILKGTDVSEKVREVMNKNPINLPYGSSKGEVLKAIQNKRILGLPLVDTNGIIRDFALFSDGGGVVFLNKTAQIREHFKMILIIGGAGYIGSVLVRKLLEKGYKVRVLDSFIYGKESLGSINSQNLDIVEGDTRHIETLTGCLADVDAVVHLAELVGDPACALDPKLTQEINYFATLLIASVCKHYQINKFIYTSSCSVYGESKGDTLLDEEADVKPASLYARMKLSSENILKGLGDSNFSPIILRLSTVFGHSYRPRFDLVVNTLTAKAVTEGNMTIFGGDQWRPNVHVADVAKAIILVLESPLNIVGNQIFNVGHEQHNHTINQLGQMVKEIIPTASLTRDNNDTDKRNYKVSFKKIRELLNFKPDYDVRDGIKEMAEVLKRGLIKDYRNPRYSNVKYLEDIKNKA